MNMKMFIYSIKDVVADEHGPIFQAVNDQVAFRSSIQVLQGAYDPRDFVLVKLGGFSDDMKLHSEYEVVADFKDGIPDLKPKNVKGDDNE